MEHTTLSMIVVIATLVLASGESRAKPVQLSMMRSRQAQSTAERLKVESDNEKLLEDQLKVEKSALDKEKETSNGLREHQEESATRSVEMISDLQRMMTDEHTRRLAAQANAAQIQSALKSVTVDQARLGLELSQSKRTLAQRDQRLANVTEALEQAQVDIASLHRRIESGDKADAEKAEDIAAKAEDIEKMRSELKSKAAAMAEMQDSLDNEKRSEEHVVKENKAAEAAARATMAKLSSQSESLVATNAKLEAELSQEKHEVQNSQEDMQDEHDKTEELDQALTKAKLQIEQLSGVKQQFSDLTEANVHLERDYDEKVADLNRATSIAQQEDKALNRTRDTLKETVEKLQAESEARGQSDSKVRELSAALEQQKAQLESEKEDHAATSQRVTDEVERNHALEKDTDNTESMMRGERAKNKELQAKLLASEKEVKAQKARNAELNEKSKAELNDLRAEADGQLDAASKEMHEKLAAVRIEEETLRKDSDEVRAQLDAATKENKEIAADADTQEADAEDKIQKMRSESSQVKLKSKNTESALNSTIAEQSDTIKRLNLITNEQKNMLKTAAKEKAESVLLLESQAKDLRSKYEQLEESDSDREHLKQKLKKVSSALVKEHSQRLSDWKTFKVKLGHRA